MARRRPLLPIVARHLAPPAALALLAGLLAGHAAIVPARAQPPNEPGWVTLQGGFARLEDVVARGPDDLWAVGDGIVHWDGSTWRQVLTGRRPHLRAIAGLPDGTMWAVGALEASTCDLVPVVLRFDGATWSNEPVETHQPLWDVHMVAADDGWAVGGMERPVILRYDGARWRPFAEPEIGPLRAVHFRAPDDGWAVGLDGALAQWNGRDWRAAPAPRTGIDLYDVVLVDEGFGWAVGAGIDARAGVILALRDGAWRIELLDRSPLLTSISAPARDVALAVGRFGTLLRWDGSTWRDVGRTYPGGFVPTRGDEPAPGVERPSAGGDERATGFGRPGAAGDEPALDPRRSDARVDQRAAGHGRAASMDASDVSAASRSQGGDREPYERMWRDETLAEGVYLRGLTVLTDAEAMIAVGDAGQVVLIDGGTYQEVHAGRTLLAIDMLPDGSEGWIVGPDGPPLRWDRQAWRPEPGPVELSWLRDIEAVAPGVAWAVGDAGTVMRFAGGRWARVPFPTTDDLYQVSFGGPDDGWTLVNAYTDSGPESRVYRWDGSAWREAIHVCAVALGSPAADAGGGAWFSASGYYGSRHAGSLLRFDGQGWWWSPMVGARSPGDPVAWPGQVVITPDGGGWAAGGGLARLDGASWRSLIDIERFNSWSNRARVLYVDAIAARDRSAFWALAHNYRWSEDDAFGGVGSWVTWFAPAVGFDPAQPDDAFAHAHLSTVPLHDLAVARLSDGTTEVWAVGEGATILRYRQPGPSGVPAASATPPAAPTGRWPTPTPHAVLGRAAAEAWVRSQFPALEEDQPLAFARVELVDRAEASSRMRRAYDAAGRFDTYGRSWGRGLDNYFTTCQPGWAPWWWIEARGDSEEGCNLVLGALDATDGRDAEFLCARQQAVAFLPFAQTRRSGAVEPTPSPYPTATPRSLTPEAVTSVDGPCPTPTPRPTTEGWPYP